jgi:hypothetical protein
VDEGNLNTGVKTQTISRRQEIFRDWTVDVLLYAVVLGFFNDYTGAIYIDSFSTTFLAALVMKALLAATFRLEHRVGNWFKAREGKIYKAGYILTAWAIMFFSKFIFLEVIDFVFGKAVEITGFVGLVLMILTMIIARKIINMTYLRLADN